MPTPLLAELSDRLIYSAIAVYALAMLTYAYQAARRAQSPAQGSRRVQAVAVGGPSEIGRRSEEHTSELQSRSDLVCRLLLEKNFFFNDTATTEIYTLSLHDALPI